MLGHRTRLRLVRVFDFFFVVLSGIVGFIGVILGLATLVFLNMRSNAAYIGNNRRLQRVQS